MSKLLRVEAKRIKRVQGYKLKCIGGGLLRQPRGKIFVKTATTPNINR